MTTVQFQLLAALKALSFGLGRRLVFFFGGLIGIFAVAALVINLQTQHKMLERRLQARTEALGKLLAEVSSSYLYEFKVSDLEIILENMMRGSDMTILYVTDADGMVVANGDIDVSNFFEVPDDSLLARAIENGSLVEERGDEFHAMAVPVLIGRDLLGFVRTDLSLKEFNEDVALLRGVNSLLGISFIISGIVLSAFVAGRVTNPLGKLIRVTEFATEGNLDHEIILRTNDELETLANSFNRMLQNLRLSLQQVNHLAYSDKLTSLPNRAFFSEYLEAIAERVKSDETNASVFFLDLDRFKEVNDTLGHDYGDELLKEFGLRLQTAIKNSGWTLVDTQGIKKPSEALQDRSALLARLGGDEFTIVLNGTGAREDASFVAEQILEVLQAPAEIGIESLKISSSVGIALMPDHSTDAHGVMRDADTAMYQAKKAGRGRYLIFDPKMAEIELDKLSLELGLRTALVEDQLLLHFQPQFEIATGNLIGAEALLRWQHPTRGLVYPDDFLHVAENAGLLPEIGRFVLSKALQTSRTWPDVEGRSLRIAINMSAEELSVPENIDFILDDLKQNSFPGSRLEIEVSERTAMADDQILEEHFSLLRFAEVRLAVDDFGIGYSNLSRLKRLRFQVLKIDRSLLSGVEVDSESAALIASILQMSRALGLEVVAEGIESQSQLEFLRSIGCDYAQGYSLGRPMDAEEFHKTMFASENRLSGDTMSKKSG